ESGEKLHPTQKPESLLHRVIVGTTRPGDTVLDPFFGTGTTGAVAKRLGRHFIGIERDREYAATARARIAAVDPYDTGVITLSTARRTAPRIPFGTLVERGLIRPGQVLVSIGGRHRAKVRADGTLVASGPEGGIAGSIHQVGARLEGAPSCNGWTYWHVEEGGTLVPIDIFRQRVRAEQEGLA
ncbi:MAG: site-specific DNA-methyltransferase, partial [Pseudomonadota bacterium]